MKNQLKTLFLLGSLAALFAVTGYWIAGTKGLLLFLGFAGIINAIAYFYSDKMVLGLYQARPLDEKKYAKIYDMVHELCKIISIPVPRLYLIDKPIANAMATGRNPHHAAVAVTSGILDILEPHELRGVLAHELSHIKNRDILIMSIAATFATAIGQISHSMQQTLRFGSRDPQRNQNARINLIALALGTILMPIAAILIRFALSRSREYMADESGAYSSEDPLALASALEKLHESKKHHAFGRSDTKYAATAPLFILNPFAAAGALGSLFATHPPVKERIARLKEIAKKLKNRT